MRLARIEDPLLESLITRAVQANRDLRTAEGRVREARELYERLLGLGAQVVDDAVEEVLGQLGVEFLCRDRAVRNGLV